MRPSLRLPIIVALLAVLAWPAGLAGFPPPTGPTRPEQGPGGKQGAHAEVKAVQIGVDEEKVFLFEPASPSPASAPLLVFLHGWFHPDPAAYRAWIDHLVRQGWIVIFPCYQGQGEPLRHYTANAARSVKEALRFLYAGGHPEPDRDRVAVIGHEGGAVVAANLAAGARMFKIPQPTALQLMMPSRRPKGLEGSGIEVYDLSWIPEGSRLVMMVGEDDRDNGMETARDLFYEMDHLMSRDRVFLTLLTDLHGKPALVGDAEAPLAPVEKGYERALEKRRLEFVTLYPYRPHARNVRAIGVDAMDWLGTWRVFDVLAGLSFAGFGSFHPADLFADNDRVRFMGHWSDGRPVRGLLATERP